MGAQEPSKWRQQGHKAESCVSKEWCGLQRISPPRQGVSSGCIYGVRSKLAQVRSTGAVDAPLGSGFFAGEPNAERAGEPLPDRYGVCMHSVLYLYKRSVQIRSQVLT
jgi:hypothetical protein